MEGWIDGQMIDIYKGNPVESVDNLEVIVSKRIWMIIDKHKDRQFVM